MTMNDDDFHGLGGLRGAGLILILAGLLSFSGVYDDLYIYGAIPVKFVLLPGGLIGVALLTLGLRAAGLRQTSSDVWRFVIRFQWVWAVAFGLLLIIGVIFAVEEYNAPQEVRIEGHPSEPVFVEVGGADPFTHRIEPGSHLELSIHHGVTPVVLRAGGREVTHQLEHEGYRGPTRSIAAP